MNWRSYYITVFAVAAFALVLGVYLIPTKKEFSLMYYYDKQFEQAYEGYKSLYDDGDRTISVTMPLVWIDLEFADTDDAINIMEDYVGENSRNLDAFVFLGGMYQDADRPYDYLQNLSDIYRLRPSVKILREQAALYRHFGEVSRAVAVLREIINKYDATEEEYRDLVFLYARRGDYTTALATATEMIQHFPMDKLQPESVRIAVGLLTDEGEQQRAVALARKYIAVNGDLTSIIDLAYLFSDRGLYRDALEIINTASKDEEYERPLIVAKSSILGSMGSDEELFRYLNKIFEAKKLPDSLVPDLVKAALYTSDGEKYLSTIVKQINFSAVSRELILKIAEFSAVNNNKALADSIMEQVGKERLLNDPFLTVILSLARGVETEPLLQRLHAAHQFSDDQLATLVSLYHRKGYDRLAKEILGNFHSFENIDDDELFELATTYVDLKMTEEGLDLIEELRSHNLPKDTDVDEAWMLLSTAQGEDDQVRRFLKEDDTVEEDILMQIYATALAHGEEKLSLDIAEKLVGRTDSPVNRLLLAASRVINGDDAAVNEVEELIGRDIIISDVSLAALASAAKKADALRSSFLTVVDKQLQNPDISGQKKRTLGYLLVDGQLKKRAAGIFFELAKDKSFDNPDMQTLLSLWGEKLDDDQLAYVVKHAEESEKTEKGKWLQHLVDTHNADEAVDLVDEEDLATDTVLDAYIGAAAQLQDKELLAYAVTRIPRDEERLPRLKGLGKIIADSGMYDQAEELYLRVLEKDSNDADTWKQLGIISYQKGAFTASIRYFRCYFVLEAGDYLSHYYYALALTEKEKDREAKPFFCSARHKLELMPSRDHSQDMILAHVYARLNRPVWARGIFRKLLQQSPTDFSLRIDYANFLIENQYFGSAARILRETTANGPRETVTLLQTRARWFRETGNVGLAEKILCRLYAEDPENVDLLASVADVEYVLGSWRRSLSALNIAECRQPGNESLRRAKHDLLADHSPYMAGNYEYRKTGDDQREHFSRLYGKSYLLSYSYLSCRAEWDLIHVNDFINMYGVLEDANETVPRGFIAIGNDFCSGMNVLGTLFLAEGIFGAGGEASVYDSTGQWTVLGWLNSPCWDFVETTLQHGTKDRVLVGRKQRIRRWLEAELALALNRYNLVGLTNAASSWSAVGLVVFRPFPDSSVKQWLGRDSNFSLNYGLDKENRTSIVTRIDANGFPFNPVPLTNREDHTFYFYLEKKLCQLAIFQSYGGYVYDTVARGKARPVGGVSVVLGKKDWWEGRFDFNHSTSTEREGEIVDSYKFELRRAF